MMKVFVLSALLNLCSSQTRTTTQCTADAGWQAGCACYGAGGGHGSWTCGNSQAGCSEAGGVASYDPGYLSSRMGCCMCESGCDHSAETGSCSYPPSQPQPLSENPGAIAGIIVGAV